MKTTITSFPVLLSHLLFLPITISTTFAQNVGVGTALPSEKLEVEGNVKADTIKTSGFKMTPNAGMGKVLTSDAFGNGDWQELSMQNDPPEDGNIGHGAWGDCET